MLEKIYGVITTQTVKVLEYSGMTLDFTDKKKAHVQMDNFVEKIIEESTEGMKGEVMSPTANFLFDVNDDSKNLDDGCAQIFHTITAKLLFLCKCA